ncbi:hypothetical protein OF83DRAFT_1162007 [Amylostereum chailletii]|nr:hypothetical protein OF83DRAFT_1162007 [Amylostereum chailletii]
MSDSRSNSSNTSRRRSTSAASLGFFTPSAASFQPRPYNPNASTPLPIPKPPPRNQMLSHQVLPMDPSPADPTAVFISPPFTDFPDSHLHPEGLTYAIMAAHPDYFLKVADFIPASGVSSNPHAIPYSPQLEPPRGWCPSKKKDLKERGSDGWPEGEEPRLRCTFCRRTYAGVNAKSMWRRHILEKHDLAMSNRRDEGKNTKGKEKENYQVQTSFDPSLRKRQ